MELDNVNQALKVVIEQTANEQLIKQNNKLIEKLDIRDRIIHLFLHLVQDPRVNSYNIDEEDICFSTCMVYDSSYIICNACGKYIGCWKCMTHEELMEKTSLYNGCDGSMCGSIFCKNNPECKIEYDNNGNININKFKSENYFHSYCENNSACKIEYHHFPINEYFQICKLCEEWLKKNK